MYIPESTPSDGTLKVTFSPVATATAVNINGATSKELSCYLTSDGFTPGTDEASVVDSRLCSKQDFEQPGRISETLEIAYVYNIATPSDDVARLTLAPRTVGFLFVRWGVDVEEEWAAGDAADIYPIKTGVQRKQPPEQNSVLKIMQKTFITAEVQRDVVLG